MTSSLRIPSSARDWPKVIEEIAGHRCDLDVLLKDEWRHRIPVRDVPDELGPSEDQVLVLDVRGCLTCEPTSRADDRLHLAAVALMVFHRVLGGYGHGSATAIGFVDACSACLSPGRLLPTVVDHADLNDSTCDAAMEAMTLSLRRDESYVDGASLIGRGLFDAILVLTDRDPLKDALPWPLPLAAVIRIDAMVGRVTWTMSYARELFEHRVIEGVLEVVQAIFEEWLRRPAQRVGDVELVTESQRYQLNTWNATEGEFPVDLRLEELIEDAVRRTPDAEAIRFRDVSLTYQQLNERCNRFAHWLLGPAASVQPDELIGLFLDKSHLPALATIGIWKAGSACVPIDPNYPADRVRLVVGDTGLTRIVTNHQHVGRLREVLADHRPAVEILVAESVFDSTSHVSADNPRLRLGSARPAYVMYTSGTTGIPKGVVKQHRNVVNSITDLSERYRVRGHPGEERIAQFAGYVFEPFMRQMLLALINSHVLVVVPDDVRLDPHRFSVFMARNHITYLNGTFSLLQHFDLRGCRSLRKLVLVGEELTAAGLRSLREKFHGHVIVEYSFTESAFVTSIKEFGPGVVERRDRSVGRPLRNIKWYVLDNHLKIVPIGAIGELYVGGCGVAEGYLNRPELSAERFLANPFRTEREHRRGENGILYRTGDLARMLPNGEIEFMGRRDFQLKLNGVRIEPGEIEARATEFPGVQKCIVVARPGPLGASDRRLVGYFVAAPSSGVDETELLAYLEERLIPVMVPARMVRVPSFPLNVVGKVDWRALPDVPPTGLAAARPAPAAASHGDALVDILRAIWSDVLGIPAATIQASDDFFRYGGHSISCILLITRVRERLRRAVSVEDVFQLRSFVALAEHIDRQPYLARPEDDEPPATPSSDHQPVKLPANGLQQGLVYHALKSDPADDAYVMQSVYRYRCSIRAELMEQAWKYAQRTYPSLRLRFELHHEPVQVVDTDAPPLDWRVVDLTHVDGADAREARIQALQRRDRAEPYALEEGRLFRLYLIKEADDLYVCLFSCHHIILDGWSLPVLHDYVHRTYLQLLRGAVVEPSTDTAYLATQRYWEAHRGDHVAYWTQRLEQIGERADLNGLVNAQHRYQVDVRAYDRVSEHRTRSLRLGAALTGALTAACAAHRLTLHSILQFVWHKVLHAIGGGRTTVIGTIVSGRNLPITGIEHSVGLFINTLPIVVDHDVQFGQTVVAAAAEIQATTNAVNSRSTVHLADLRSGGMKGQLFDSLLVLENYPRLLDAVEEDDHLKHLRFEHSYDVDKVNHPLAVVAREEGDELVVHLWYAGELFDDIAIDTLLGTARVLFEQVADDIAQPVGGLELVSADTLRIFDAWNETDADFARDVTLHGIFEDAAARCPDDIAVIFRDTRLTYRELNERANRVAHHLRSNLPVRPDDLLAIVMNKSEQQLVAILAVWKAGAAYVPIDPESPDDRVTFMLDDTRAQMVLADKANSPRLRALLGDGPRRVLEMDLVPLDAQPAHNPISTTSSTNLAYAIYTSGTTGRPKAVLVEHRGVVNLQASLASRFSLSKVDGREVFLSFSNYVFDHFVEQMTDALLNGQTLVVLDDDLRADNRRLCQYIAEHGVTYLSGTPSVLSMYDFSSAPSLTRIDAIGEDLTASVFDTIRRSFGGTIINGYGPTEISITSHKRPYAASEPRNNKSIGVPVANTTCYVLDEQMRRVPIGGIGELLIGGVGVARGYLHRDELTAERFIANPFQTMDEERRDTNARLYRTGDLVRWLPNGELEYLGRNDQQVKIRGHRVELGEIEAVLSSHPDVRRSVVVARERPSALGHGSGEKYLVGFYVSDLPLVEQDLVRWMRTALPAPLVPARIVAIDEVPVTASGKLDVRRLPPTDFTEGSGSDYVPPSTGLETALCGVWSKVLSVPPGRIGVHDDFFSLGGDSLRVIKLASAITKDLGRVLRVPAVFEHTTVASQARHLEERETITQDWSLSPAGVAAWENGDPPVSFAQERLVFIDEFLGGSDAYNIPFVLEINASALQPSAVTGALRVLLRRHAAMRTLLRGSRDGVRLQSVLGEDVAAAMFEIPEYTVESKADLDAKLIDDAAYVFRLDSELPIRARIYEISGAPGTRYLSVVVHHSCFDGWSLGIWRRELSLLVGGAAEAQLPQLSASYCDFAVWQRRQLTGERLSSLTEFWSGTLQGFEPLNLPTDSPRPSQFDYRGRECLFTLDLQTTADLRELARSVRVSLYSVLLGVAYLMLETYTGHDDLVVGTPSANRGRPEFDGVVGLFANLLVLRTKVDRTSTIASYLRSVGDTVVQAHVHQELPFEQLLTLLDVQPDASRHPIVQTVVTLTQDDGATDHPSAAIPGAVTIEYRPDARGWTTAKFDLSVALTEVADGLAGNITYAAALFEPETVAGFAATFTQIARELARLRTSVSTALVSEVRRVDDIAKADVSAHHHATAPARRPASFRERTLPWLFEQVAVRSAGEVAVACRTSELTYRELNERANAVAHHLLATGVRPNDLVALVMDKSERVIVAIVAVWKAGAAYVPIDPGYPDERVVFMLDDTHARVVVADGAHCDRVRRLSAGVRQVINLDESVDRLHRDNPMTTVSAGNLAYAIYTSGTSGRPKAVMVEHRNVVSLHDDLTSRYFSCSSGSRQSVLFLSSIVFDFSIEQLLLSIFSGHTLIVPPSSLVFDDEFYQHVNAHGLTYLSGTPTQIDLFDLTRLEHLQLLLVAGEAFKPHHYEKIRREYSGPILSAYGTTETTVYNTVQRFDPGDSHRNALGEPLSNTRLYVLDRDRQPLPRGAVGELFIAGECVSAGYLYRPELTRDRFVPNPFLSEDERTISRWPTLYKTGDIVRRRMDGDLEFLGRNDSQVKINGLRVELGEVEAALASLPGIRQCAVVLHEGQRARLVGYYVPRGDATVDEADVVAHLRSRLVPAAVPGRLVRVERFLPMTSNGKLDTAGLPPIDAGPMLEEDAPPRSRLESRLCRIWSDVLGTDVPVGLDSDFFRCGGDSIAALHLASELRRELGRKIGVKLVFDHPTVRGFVDQALLTATRDERAGAEDFRRRDGSFPLLPIQAWFFAKQLSYRHHWNQYFAIRTPPLDAARLRDSINRLADHHDAFRLRFLVQENGADPHIEQCYVEHKPNVTLDMFDVRGSSDEKVQRQLEEWQSGFDIERGPLCCAAYLDGFNDGTARVWLAMHHLIVDSVSWRIIAQDLEILYHGGDLGARGPSYRQWVAALQHYKPTPTEVDLWEEVAARVTTLATASSSAAPGALRRHERITMGEADTTSLLAACARVVGARFDDLLLTAVGGALQTVTGHATNYITVEGHGREAFDGAPDVGNTVGWFTTMHPVAVEVDDDFIHSIRLTSARRAQVPHHGIGYGAIRGIYGGGRAPLPPTSFNYLGRFHSASASLARGQTARWQLDAEMCGTSRAATDAAALEGGLDVTMQIIGHDLVVDVESLRGPADTHQFVAELRSRLAGMSAIGTVAGSRRTGVERRRHTSTQAPDSAECDPYIVINAEASGPVLFVLPPGEGGAESYLNNIARELPGIRLVLFNNVHLHQPMASFQELARYHLDVIGHLQPDGAYSFFGWSFGGVLALEIALQLARAGEHIANLMLVDSFFNVGKAASDIGLPDVNAVVDPINGRYNPDADDLARLAASTGRVLLFKAAVPSRRTSGVEQTRLFEYYASSPYNNLDTLLPAASITVELMADETHFSWITNASLVASMTARIRELVRPRQEIVTVWRDRRTGDRND